MTGIVKNVRAENEAGAFERDSPRPRLGRGWQLILGTELPEELEFDLWHYFHFLIYSSAAWFNANKGNTEKLVRWIIKFMPSSLQPYLQSVPYPKE